MAMEVAEQALLAFVRDRVLFPEKIVQIFSQAIQERINCLSATLLDGRTELPIEAFRIDRFG